MATNSAAFATLVMMAVHGLIGCGTTPVNNAGGLEESSTCSAVRPQSEPDLMGWDSGSRAKLHSLRNQGVVAVRYAVQGCNVELEVLENCIGKGRYEFTPYAASDTKIARNSRELFAELPIGAARLGGKVKNGKALRTDFMMAGSVALPAGLGKFDPQELHGSDCSKATHVVRTIYLGGFAMASGNSQEIEAGASLFGIGAGANTSSSTERVASEGIASACKKAQEDGKESGLCAVPLRLSLLAIDGREAIVLAPPAPTATSATPPSTPSLSPGAMTPTTPTAPAGPSSGGKRAASVDELGRRAFDRLAARDAAGLFALMFTQDEMRQFDPEAVKGMSGDELKTQKERLFAYAQRAITACMGTSGPAAQLVTVSFESSTKTPSPSAPKLKILSNAVAVRFQRGGEPYELSFPAASLEGVGWIIGKKMTCEKSSSRGGDAGPEDPSAPAGPAR